ncbi:MAG TPA: TadE family protein [Candidatus Deferrimicrobium sp.]|nr:TadE family protein [Candidatus Deferrimicrobium sp.]
MSLHRARHTPPPRRRPAGQSVVEFALVFPVLLLLLAGIADLGRIYTSMVAVESAAREAADYGSFHASYWNDVNRPTTVADMERRACTAAAGSHLDGYTEPAGTVAHATCTNPSFSYTLEPDDPSCSNPMTEPPCIVHVRMDYDFGLFLGIPPMPSTIHITRDSRFLMGDLTPP